MDTLHIRPQTRLTAISLLPALYTMNAIGTHGSVLRWEKPKKPTVIMAKFKGACKTCHHNYHCHHRHAAMINATCCQCATADDVCRQWFMLVLLCVMLHTSILPYPHTSVLHLSDMTPPQFSSQPNNQPISISTSTLWSLINTSESTSLAKVGDEFRTRCCV